MKPAKINRIISTLFIAYALIFSNAWADDPDPKFLQSVVMVRPGILDLGDITVQQYVDRLKKVSLTDGSSPKSLGWTKQNNRYTLKLKMIEQYANLTFVHDLSAQSNGAVSLLLPVTMAGKRVNALRFTMLIMGQ